MNKTTFIAELAVRTGQPVTEVRKFVDVFLALTTEVLAHEDEIVFLRFGRFYPRKQVARPVRNPKNRSSGYARRAHYGSLQAR